MLKKQSPFTTTFGSLITILIIGVIILVLFKFQSAPATKIVLMGDSITESWSGYSPDFFSNNSYLINKGINKIIHLKSISNMKHKSPIQYIVSEIITIRAKK